MTAWLQASKDQNSVFDNLIQFATGLSIYLAMIGFKFRLRLVAFFYCFETAFEVSSRLLFAETFQVHHRYVLMIFYDILFLFFGLAFSQQNECGVVMYFDGNSSSLDIFFVYITRSMGSRTGTIFPTHTRECASAPLMFMTNPNSLLYYSNPSEFVWKRNEGAATRHMKCDEPNSTSVE